jgi:glycosyltransferase involved in cell wall biosynthesis
MPNIKVGIAGSGTERKKIEMEISRLHLESNVNMLGYINDTADCYNSGRIFVLNSSSEGLPRTILQAMACGLPCVSSDVGDISDIITNGINGYLIEDYNDIENYVKVIHELLFSPNNTKLGRKARESIEKYHSYESTSLLWENILRHIDNYKNKN